MNYTQITMGIMLSLLIGSATADCLSSVMPKENGTITWSDLAKYDACLKADKATAARAPLTLEQATWAAACSGGAFVTGNQCFGGNPNAAPVDPLTYNPTKLVLQVTNIYAVANLSLTATYPADSIWIGYFPPGNHTTTSTSVIPSPGSNVQAVCGAFTEIGWGIPGSGIHTKIDNIATDTVNTASHISITEPGDPSLSGITMATNLTNVKLPLYIICVGRSTNTTANTVFTPAALPSTFAITWVAAP